ncbi:MAG TPA: hypothetical protein VMC82_03070 [Thermoplasmata archaeon]|nr:hypothetical protein [Thermoplasmata archaeon]
MSAPPFPSATATNFPHSDLLGRLRRSVLLSIAGIVAWVCFTLLYVGFWAQGFSLFQSIIVIVVSLVVLAGVLAGAWISFGMRFARRHWEWDGD